MRLCSRFYNYIIYFNTIIDDLQDMLKTFLKWLILFLFTTIVAIGSFAAFKPAVLKSSAKSMIEYLASNKIVSTKIESLDFSKDNMILHHVTLHQGQDTIISIEEVDVQYNLRKSIRKLGLYFNVQIKKFSMDDISLSGGGVFIVKKSMTEIRSFKVDFGQGAYIDCAMVYKTFLGAPYLLYAHGDVVDLPLMVHKAFWHVAPDNGIVDFMKNFILSGKISGKWLLNLDKEFFADQTLDPENLQGSLKITGLDLKYDEEFPVVKNLNSDLLINGTNISFDITQAYSGKILLSDSKVTLDWGGGKDLDLIVKAKGKGGAVELTSFIPLSHLEALKEHDIDLTALKGQSFVDVDIVIPLAPGTKNIYNINVDITGAKLGIFGNAVALDDGKLKGNFNGDSVTIDGDSKINGFNSKLFYQMNLSEEKKKAFDHSLQVKLNFAPSKAIKQGAFVVDSGKANIDISYVLKNDDATFAINSDLRNVGFTVAKMGLYKPKGRAAILKVEGDEGSGPMPSKLNISLIGADGLKIIGEYTNNKTDDFLSFSEIKYTNTDMKADVLIGDHSLKLNVVGRSLDLSRADIFRYLDKESDAKDTELLIKLDSVKMKNEVEVSDVILRIRCDKVKCYDGFLESRIGTKPLKMEMASKENSEQWRISTENAGAFFNALGIYQKMQAGSLVLTVNTSRQEVKAGEQISIIDGDFAINKFVIVDTPFVTKMLSFSSIQGLLDSIKTKKHVSFTVMNGGFGYKNDILRIADAKGEGVFFDFTMKGYVDTSHREFGLKGRVIPSLYGLNNLVRKLPVVGNLLQFFYSIKDSY